MSVLPLLNMEARASCNTSTMDQHSAVPEPNTALTNMSKVTFLTSAASMQHDRHKSQGPMRTEKVYNLTNIIKQKTD